MDGDLARNWKDSSVITAQSFQYVQVIGTGTDDARGRAFHERGNERERLVEGGWGIKESRVGYHAQEAASLVTGARARTGPRHPVRRAPSAG